ncbi:MAG TPA: hypothetical protein VMA83_04435 [Solirubrobacteraceae bacterium]|nr:hypothetical protein [Solirubrobacteraceae bacterium]
MAGTVIVQWYATGFRGDEFEQALSEAAAVAMRYGASSYHVYRSREDRYRMMQFAAFEDYTDWERYWEGPEMAFFRARTSGWFQVPIQYAWWDQVAAGEILEGLAATG